MIASLTISALALLLQAAPSPSVSQGPTPELSIEQRTSLRCAAAFAIVANGQQNGNAQALAFPALGERGKEYFVRASAQLMDQAGLTRDQVSALLSAEAQALWDTDRIEEVMPPCLSLLEASGL